MNSENEFLGYLEDAREKVNEKADIYIVGLGMDDGLYQLSKEGEILLKKSRMVFYISPFDIKIQNKRKVNLIKEYHKYSNKKNFTTM